MKNHNNEPESADTIEYKGTYGINHLNLVETAQELESDSKWLLV